MIIRGQTIEEYHASANLSKSKLMTYAKHGPAHFKRQYIDKTMPQPDKPAFAIGRAFDDLMCLGYPTWATKPAGFDGRTAAGKQWVADHAGRDVLSVEDNGMLEEMRMAMMSNPNAAMMWPLCEKQVTLEQYLPAHGVTIQSRPDGFDIPGERLIDIKTCRDLNAFSRDCITYGYHCQIAMGQWIAAQHGHQLEAFLIVVEAKLAPRCKVLRIPEVALAAGWNRCKSLIDQISAHRKSGDWTEQQAEVETLALEAWQERKLEGEAA